MQLALQRPIPLLESLVLPDGILEIGPAIPQSMFEDGQLFLNGSELCFQRFLPSLYGRAWLAG